MSVSKKCPECGSEFAPKATNQVYCCEACYKQNHLKTKLAAAKAKRRTAAENRKAHEVAIGNPCRFDDLTRATTKPKNCSAIRWRIELRRRARAEYYKECGCMV